MCLNIGIFSRKKIAKEPIKVYKVYLKRDNTETFVSPYTRSELDIYKTQESNLGVEWFNRDSIRTVEEGLHSIESLKDAWSIKLQEDRTSGFSSHIFECEIPTKSEYYKGTWSWIDGNSFASTKLVIKRELTVERVKEIING